MVTFSCLGSTALLLPDTPLRVFVTTSISPPCVLMAALPDSGNHRGRLLPWGFILDQVRRGGRRSLRAGQRNFVRVPSRFGSDVERTSLLPDQPLPRPVRADTVRTACARQLLASASRSARQTKYHTIPRHTTPHNTLPYHTIPYHTLTYPTIP